MKLKLNLSLKKEPPDKTKKSLLHLKRKLQTNIQNDFKNIQKNLEENYKDKKRMDKVLAKKEQSFFSNKVIKSKLNTISKDSKVVKNLNDIVMTISNMSWATYNFLNLHILRILENNKLIPKLDQTLINRVACLVTVQNGKANYPNGVDSELLETLKNYKSVIPDTYKFPDRAKLGTIQNFIVQEIGISIKNHLELNFESRFLKYLKLVHNLSDRWKRKYIFRTVFNMRGNYPSKFDKDEKCQELVKHYRTEFQYPTDDSKLSNPYFTLPYYYKMLKMFKEKGVAAFSLLPRKSTLIPEHITISTSCLVDILSLWTKKPKRIFDVLDKDERWKHIFNIPKRSKNDWFGGMITTNGYDVSIYYKRPPKGFKYSKEEWESMSYVDRCVIIDKIKENRKSKKESKKEFQTEIKRSDLEDDVRLLGNDVGHRYMFTMVDKNGNFTRCSGKEYHHMTGIKETRKRINRRKDSIELLKDMCKWSLKVSSVEEYLENLRNQFKNNGELIKEYSRKYYRKLGFTSRIKKTKAFYKLGERIEGRYERTVIGWGDGGTNQKGLKGNHIPNKEFKRHLLSTRSSITTVVCDEYCTTKKCSECGSDTIKVKHWREIRDQDKNVSLKLVETYGLRRCNNNECRITWDRDVNACINILKIFECCLNGKERPGYLCRPKKTVSETSRSLELTKSPL